MNQKIEQLKTEVGAIAETVKMMYDAYINQGFTKSESLVLVSKYIEVIFKKMKYSNLTDFFSRMEE